MGKLLSFEKHKRQSCEHHSVLVDEELWQITCKDCGEVLDPIAYLVRLSNKQSYQGMLCDRYRELVVELQKKLRDMNKCKCEHCGKFTKIDKKLRV